MSHTPSFIVLLGSVTPPGRMHHALGNAINQANENGTDNWALIDLGTLQVGFADGTPIDQLEDDTNAFVDQVSASKGVLIASPVYRASLTGALKNALDLLPVDALREKPVGILAMGGSNHHFLGVASHLRDVLAWFGAIIAPTDVYLTSADFSDGLPSPEAASELESLLAAITTLSRSLAETELGPPPLAAKF